MDDYRKHQKRNIWDVGISCACQRCINRQDSRTSQAPGEKRLWRKMARKRLAVQSRKEEF